MDFFSQPNVSWFPLFIGNLSLSLSAGEGMNVCPSFFCYISGFVSLAMFHFKQIAGYFLSILIIYVIDVYRDIDIVAKKIYCQNTDMWPPTDEEYLPLLPSIPLPFHPSTTLSLHPSFPQPSFPPSLHPSIPSAALPSVKDRSGAPYCRQ